MDPQEIKQRFASAGWELDAGFSGYLVIGCSRDNTLSIVAHPEKVSQTAEDPLPTPSKASQMLRENGEPPEEG